MSRRVPLGRMVAVVASLSVPTVLVLVVLAALELLPVLPAVAAALACIAMLAVLARRVLADLIAVGEYADSLGHGEDAPPPELRYPGALPELAQAVARVRQSSERQRRDLEALAQSTETVLESLPDPVFLLDDHRHVVRATRAATALLGGAPLGRDLSTYLRNPAVLQGADSVLAGRADQEVEFTMLDPVERSFSARIARLRRPTADGAVALATLRDLTAARRAEQLRVDFVANASHELRTPLSVLVGCIKTLRGAARDDAEAQARFLDMMDAQADRMARLVEDLLSLSRIELNEHRLPAETVDLARLIAQVADSMTFPASARDVRIETQGLDALPSVIGDEIELGQLFQNLVDNAIKYGAAGGTVTISGRHAVSADKPPHMPRDRDAVAVSVADQGEGIAAEHLPRLTERFYRVDTARSRELGGTGLGLAIVKHIVSRHRGHLAVESEEGVGSTFTVFLPAAHRDEAGRAEAPPASEAAPQDAAGQ